MPLPGLHEGNILWLDLEDAGFDSSMLALVEAESDEFESVLGCRVHVGSRRSDEEATWTVTPRSATDAPCLVWEPSTLTMTSHANGPNEVMSTMQLLHTVARQPRQPAVYRAPDSPAAAARLIHDEVLGTYPSFALRSIDRHQWVGRRLQEVPDTWAAFTPWAQEWVAELGDAHTAVIARDERGHNLSYVGTLTSEGVTLEAIPPTAPAWRAGVRPGWVVTVDRPERWLRTTGATPQQHARVAARRTLAVPGEERTFEAHDPRTGRTAAWVERPQAPALSDVLEAEPGPDGVIRLRLAAFLPEIGIEEAFDDLCRDARPTQLLELDLRGNTGGNLMLAMRLRDRFLRKRTRIGSIAFSTGRGGLAPVRARWANPSARPCWPGRLRVLVDSMTYSAAEDFLLGLQGLDHVTVAGERTGGGSGRPRALPLGPGLTLRVSTAITYDRQGQAVEFHGVQPD